MALSDMRDSYRQLLADSAERYRSSMEQLYQQYAPQGTPLGVRVPTRQEVTAYLANRPPSAWELMAESDPQRAERELRMLIRGTQ